MASYANPRPTLAILFADDNSAFGKYDRIAFIAQLLDLYRKNAIDIVAKENKIDVLIDDSIKHCTNVSKLGIPVLMVATDYNKQSDFRKVKNWEEIYNVISKGMI